MKPFPRWISVFVAFHALVILSLVNVRCTTTGQPSPVVAQIAVEYAVMKFCENNPSHAPRVAEIARNVKAAASGNVSATVATLDALVRSQIKWEKLTPADTQLVNLLLDAIEAELTARVGAGTLDPQKLLVVQQVAGWIETAASVTQPPAVPPR